MTEINPLGMTKEEYIKAALPYKKMEAGLGSRPVEKLQEIPEVPKKNLTLWHLEENANILFRTHEEALKCLPYILVSSWYGEQPKDPEGKITSRQFFDNETLNTYKEIINEATRIKDNNDKIQRDINNYDNQVNSIIYSLSKEWEETEQQRRLKEEIINTFNEFLELTNQDKNKAFVFLAKTFKSYDEIFLTNIIEE